jgi:cysteine desulfurase
MTPIYLHTDASQGVGQIDVNVARLGVDAITINAGKIYGPKQSALLWTASSVKLSPQIVGGGQERGLRSGTENVASAMGFALALELAVDHRKSEAVRLSKLRDTMQARLLEAFPAAELTGSAKKRLPGHLHISFPGVDAERLIFGLEAEGVMVATGSACAANKGTRSHVLTALGVNPEVADGSLRITLGRLTNDQTIERATAIMVKVIQQEISRSSS